MYKLNQMKLKLGLDAFYNIQLATTSGQFHSSQWGVGGQCHHRETTYSILNDKCHVSQNKGRKAAG